MRLIGFKMAKSKTLDINDLNQVVPCSGFSENKGLVVCSVSRAHQIWSRSLLLKDFRTVCECKFSEKDS